jgi:hypothetical protein
VSALSYNITGGNNTAVGADALLYNTAGSGNTGIGFSVLVSSTGDFNTAVGGYSLDSNTTGGYNIALGFDAGYNVTTGSNNIEIGSMGTASDNGTIQIGVQGTQTTTTIAGIYGTPVTGAAVYVTPTGQLGVQASSERYEEGDKVYPELVIRDEAGKIQGVHYEELAPMLLAEVKKQQRIIASLSERLAKLELLNETAMTAAPHR